MISYSLSEPLPDGLYVISYSSLREDYRRYVAMSDDEFKRNLVQVLHFACVTCWLKEAKAQHVLADNGIIHELVHLLEGFYQGNDDQFQAIRGLFKQECCLV